MGSPDARDVACQDVRGTVRQTVGSVDRMGCSDSDCTARRETRCRRPGHCLARCAPRGQGPLLIHFFFRSSTFCPEHMYSSANFTTAPLVQPLICFSVSVTVVLFSRRRIVFNKYLPSLKTGSFVFVSVGGTVREQPRLANCVLLTGLEGS